MLSSDTELSFEQYREFCIRFGLLNEKQAMGEGLERQLLDELWAILARNHPK